MSNVVTAGRVCEDLGEEGEGLTTASPVKHSGKAVAPRFSASKQAAMGLGRSMDLEFLPVMRSDMVGRPRCRKN